MSQTSIVTLDFEDSSLAEAGYPIEVAVVIGNCDGIQLQFSTLIAPRPEWNRNAHWSEASEAIHGIKFECLSDAMPADTVCNMLDPLLADRSVFVDSGTYDQCWLDRLYSGRPIPFRLDHLQGVDPREFMALKNGIQIDHRALPDATWLYSAVRALWDRPPSLTWAQNAQHFDRETRLVSLMDPTLHGIKCTDSLWRLARTNLLS